MNTGLTKTIVFEDHGQDFLEWDVENGLVIACRPFQASVWVGHRVLNKTVRKGGFVKTDKLDQMGCAGGIKYPVEKVKRLRTIGKPRKEARR